MLINRGLQKGTNCGASLDEMKNNLKREWDNLKESLEILKNVHQGSFESKIVEGSKGSVTQLEQWVGTHTAVHWSKLTLIPFLIWRTFDHSRRWEMIKEF